MRRFKIFLIFILIICPKINSAIINVPSEQPTIQDGIYAANNNDTVMIADGIYRGDGNRDITFQDLDIVIKSENGPEYCIIDCQGDSLEHHNAFNIVYLSQTTKIKFDGITVMNGYMETGGAISIFKTSPEIINCIFYNNYAIVMGGALFYVDATDETVINCLFINNSSNEGAVFVRNSSPIIIQSTFINNNGIAQIVTENYAYPKIQYCLFVGKTVHSWEECCDWAPIVGPSGSSALNCVNYKRGSLEELWNVQKTPYFDIDPQINFLDSINYEFDQTSPCLPHNNQFDRQIGYTSNSYKPVEEEQIKIIPTFFQLHQNYPNPFNPSTTIEFQIPVPQNVSITIYNLLGQNIRTLVSGFFGAGTFRFQWDGANDNGRKVTSGVYLYKLETDDFTESKKMILLK